MAKNAPWRGSAKTWRDRVASWITRKKPEDLLCVDIFFDLRAVHGDTALANGLRAHAFDLAKGQMAFTQAAGRSAGAVSPGQFFGGFRTDQGRIELKRLGLFGIVTAAQALAIRSRERSHGADGSIQPLRGRFHGRAERNISKSSSRGTDAVGACAGWWVITLPGVRSLIACASTVWLPTQFDHEFMLSGLESRRPVPSPSLV